MRRWVLVTVFATIVVSLGTLASASAARTLVSVRPARGRSTTTFVIRFRHPDQTGLVGALRRTDRLTVSAADAGSKCTSRAAMRLAPAAQGHVSAVRLGPGRRGGRWCAGRFRGSIRETTLVVCELHPLCPIPAPVSQTITRFSFRVRRAGGQAGGGGSQPAGPTFGGLISATTCVILSPQPPLPGRTYTLGWNPASDPGTPSSAIVYDVYYSSTRGGEDYSDPTWTSSPGATSYTVHLGVGSAYFVVRARDQAGREDHNRMERAGVSICA